MQLMEKPIQLKRSHNSLTLNHAEVAVAVFVLMVLQWIGFTMEQVLNRHISTLKSGYS